MREDYWGESQLPDIERRLSQSLMYGTVDSVSYADKSAPRVRVKAGNFLTGWIPWLVQNAGSVQDWEPIEIGAQVLMGAPGGDLSQACILGCTPQDSFPAPSDNENLRGRIWRDGAKDTYDAAAKLRTIEVPNGGSLLIKCGSSTIEMSGSGIKINGNRLDLCEE